VSLMIIPPVPVALPSPPVPTLPPLDGGGVPARCTHCCRSVAQTSPLLQLPPDMQAQYSSPGFP